MTPLLTNAQLFNYVDSRWVAKNLLDDGTAASLADMLDTGTVAGARLEILITAASEKLMSAAAIGARYSETDVRTYGGELSRSITAGLSMGPVLHRRGRAVTDYAKLSAQYDEAEAYIEQLRRGERIFFAVPDVPEAGLPASADMGPNPLQPPNIACQASRYFGFPAAGDGYRSPYTGGNGCTGC